MTRTRQLTLGAAGVAVVLALLVFGWRERGTQEAATSPPVSSPRANPVVTPASVPTGAAPAAVVRSSPPRAPDPLGYAPDLRAVYDRFRDSTDPAERRIARRAFDTCVPAFLPAAGEAPSPEPMIDALPAAQRAEREGAWRDLFARCQRFASDSRDALVQSEAAWQHDQGAADPASRAIEAARAGRFEQAESLVASIPADDPASIGQLGGIAVELARVRGGQDRDLALRAEAVDTALPLVACDLGLACDAQSLRAIELCAVQASCQGDVPARVLTRPGMDPTMADAVQRERARLAALMRANGKLTLADLLPP